MDLNVIVAKTREVLALLPVATLGRAAEGRRRALRSQADRDDFLAARMLAVRALELAGAPGLAPAALRQRCEVCGGGHGRPLPVAGLHVSWSHSRGWVAAGAAPAPIGVDVEVFADAVGESLLQDALSPGERVIVAEAAEPARAFGLAWVAKEACVKAGAATLDSFGGLAVLAAADRLVPSFGPLLLSARDVRGATVAAASAAPVTWRSLGARGELVPLPGAGRGVATRA